MNKNTQCNPYVDNQLRLLVDRFIRRRFDFENILYQKLEPIVQNLPMLVVWKKQQAN